MKLTQKLRQSFLLSAIGLTVISSMVACKGDDPALPPPPAAKNVVEVALADSNFSILVSAVVKTGLKDALATTPNITVFAPLNSAFRDIGYTTASIEALTKTEDIEMLKNVLLYHVVGEKIPASAITKVNIGKITLKKDSLYASGNSGGVFINGVKVVKADVAASNGVIHAIGKVLLPPVGNLRVTAIATKALSFLVVAVLRADSTDNAISNALTSAGPLTVFAPTDAAFIAAGFPTEASIKAAPPYVLRKILLYHVIPARVFSGDLAAGSVGTAQGTNVTIAVSPATVKGTNSANVSKIIATDVITTNGVVHVIDQVLLP